MPSTGAAFLRTIATSAFETSGTSFAIASRALARIPGVTRRNDAISVAWTIASRSATFLVAAPSLEWMKASKSAYNSLHPLETGA